LQLKYIFVFKGRKRKSSFGEGKDQKVKHVKLDKTIRVDEETSDEDINFEDNENYSVSEDNLCSAKSTTKDLLKTSTIDENAALLSPGNVVFENDYSCTGHEDMTIDYSLDNTGLVNGVHSLEGRNHKPVSSILSLEHTVGLLDVEPFDRVQSQCVASLASKFRASSRSTSHTVAPDGENASGITEKTGVESNESIALLGKTARGFGSKFIKLDSNTVADAVDWVQCDSCAKWRSFSTTSEKVLPDKWFCHLNTWDLRYNSCLAAEEVMNVEVVTKVINCDENKTTLRKEEPGVRSVRGIRGGTGRGRTAKIREESLDIVVSDADGGPSANVSGNQRKNAVLGKFTNNVIVPVAAVNWVMCNKCRKWRKVPEYISMDVLPNKWFCSLNTWSVAFSRCSAKEEQDEVLLVSDSSDVVSNTLTDHFSSKVSRELPSRRKSHSVVNVSNNSDMQVPGGIRKVSWVQCERKNCKKWRKVPGSIDTKLFPEKWFCEMNSWDTDVANCDAPEVSDDEDDYQQTADTRSQLILSNSKGPGTLSYRRIIFGTDGKIRSCFSEKNRNGYGIFSFSETQKQHSGDLDDYFEPIRRVSFWWSGAYDESGTAYLSSKKFGKHLIPVTSVNDDVATVRNISPSTILLDFARRIEPCPVLHPLCRMAWPKKIPKFWTRLNKMTMIQREKAECIAVRSCFLATASKLLTLSALQSILLSSRFLTDDVEAIREFMDVDILKRTLRRLEDRDLISATLTSEGVLCFELILHQPSHATCSDDGHCRPLKLRKFFSGLKCSDQSVGGGNIMSFEITSSSNNDSSFVIPNVYTSHRFKVHSKFEDQL
jgi:hypothetical protein